MKNFLKKLCLLSNLFLISSAFGFTPFVVKDIKIIGLEKISKDVVLQTIDIKPGSTLSEEKSSEIIYELFKTGFFQDIKIQKDGNTAIIKLKERPVISSFELIGVKSKDKILEILKKYDIAAGRMYNPGNLTQAKEDIRNHYLMSGKYDVQIDSDTKVISDKQVAVTVSIYEGSEARVKEIKIMGNEFFSEKELLKQLHHGKTNLLSWYTKSDRYSKEKLEADTEILRSYYMDRGFVNFKVESTRVSLSPDKKEIYITINIDEGDRFNFGEINLSGDLILSKEKLLKIIHEDIKPGKFFSRKALWDVKQKIEEELGEEGYYNAQVMFDLQTSNLHKINVNFFIQPNKRIYVRRIDFTGNHLTQDEVLRRSVPQLESTWISTKDVKEGKNALMREGLSGEVNIDTIPVLGSDDQVDLLYKIEEQKTAKLSAGLAYSKADGLMYNLGADFKNFVGTGKDLNFNFDKGKDFTIYRVGYYNPFFTPDGVGFGYNIYYQKFNYSKTSDIFNYSNNSLGGNVHWSYPISEYSRINFGFGYDKSDLVFSETDAPEEVLEFVNIEGKKYSEYTVNLGLRRNTLDKYIFPTRGLLQNATFKFSAPISKLKYYRLGYSFNWYQPIVSEYIFNLNGTFGYGSKYGSTFRYPFFKNYFTGGAESVRGFEERSLGPKDSKSKRLGGNLLVQATARLIFPTPLLQESKSIRTSVFLDAGQVYDTENTHRSDGTPRNPNGLRYSAGVSLEWHSPFGVPMVFSLAKPLNAKDGDKKEFFHFTFGAQLF